MQEPKDGDFVAYIEALQRESAARLARERGVGAAAFSPAAPAAQPERVPVATTAPAPARIAPRLYRRDRAKLIKPLFAVFVGAAFLLSWLGDGGPFAFIIGIGLLAWAIPRVIAAVNAAHAAPPSKAVVDHVFGRSATPTRGTRK
jgi:hypothetical protein